MAIINHLKKHISWHSINKVAEICRPFFVQTGINYFDYGRTYKDGSAVILESEREWYEYYFKKEYPISSTTVGSGIHLWSSYLEIPLKDAKNHFNHDYGITILKKYRDYTEICDFATTPNNIKILDFYFNHLDILEQFVLYFKDKANKIIQQHEQQRLLLPDSMKGILLTKEDSHNFSLDSFKPNKYYLLGEDPHVYLTKREMACVSTVVKGKTAKEIANMLNISIKTVESYIQDAKVKLGVTSRSQLIEKVLKEYPLCYKNSDLY